MYTIVSQGVVIYEPKNKKEAVAYVKNANKEWTKYKQACLDNHEDYADNECLLYEDDENGNVKQIKI